MRSAAEPGRATAAGQRGYNMVALMIAITLLNIALAAALPMWSHSIQREKEEELITRGLQYAEAIRVFKQRFNRPPVRLEELIEVRPRSLRQLWPDPMTDHGKWAVSLAYRRPDRARQQEEQAPADGHFVTGGITGIRSRSQEKAIKVFLGSQRYDQWVFNEQLFEPGGGAQAAGAGGPNGGGPNGGGAVPGTQLAPPGAGPQALLLPARWIGRPLLGQQQQSAAQAPVALGGPATRQEDGGRRKGGGRGLTGPGFGGR